MQILARITKVDEATGKVYGRAVQEVPDRSGEIFDYATSKPNFEKWSTDMAKATDGKSVGNVRAMHGKVAAGKLTEITFADAEKAIDVCAEIVDPAEREKCIKGVYTGFSIGGRYVKKWTDGEDANLQRYTAEPTEISLVDLPCVPTAQFTVVKADGSEELRKFETTKDGVLEVRVTFDEVLQKLLDEDPDAMKHIMAKIAERKDTKPEEGEHKYGDVKFADEKNKKYPIDTEEHIRAAWNYINKPENAGKYDSADVSAIKSKIVAAWKDKIDAEGPPSAEKSADDELVKHADVQGVASEETKEALAEDASLELADKGDLAKSGRKHTKAQRAHRDAIREHAKGINEHLDAMAEDDPAKDDDEDDAEKLAKAATELQKVTSERDAANEALTKLQAEHDELLKKAAPPKGAARAVEKTLGTDALAKEPDDQPVRKADGTVDERATAEKLMKLAYSKPSVIPFR